MPLDLTQIRDLLQNKDHTLNAAMEFLRHRTRDRGRRPREEGADNLG